MNVVGHAALGAAIGLAPDATMIPVWWIGRRHGWLPPTHPAVRLHRAAPSPASLVAVAVLAYGAHLLADRYSRHNVAPGVRGARGQWEWSR